MFGQIVGISLLQAANTVNVIRLFHIIVTAILGWIFLGDKLSRKEMILMTIAFVLLIVFAGLG